MKTCVFPAQVLHPQCTRLFHVYVHGQFKFDLPCFKIMARHAATCYWYFRSPFGLLYTEGGGMDTRSSPTPTKPLDSGEVLPVAIVHSPAQAALKKVSAGVKLAVWGIMGCWVG